MKRRDGEPRTARRSRNWEVPSEKWIWKRGGAIREWWKFRVSGAMREMQKDFS
jgi:hypothetical protein